MIAIVDYGVGNFRSVERALIAEGAEVLVTHDAEDLKRAAGIVLPGVGAFAPAVERLTESGLGQQIIELVSLGKPLLGICVGYQLLYEESEEGGCNPGLGLLPGRVLPVAASRVPVMGWCRVRQTCASPLWSGIANGAYFYFAHSYTPVGESEYALGQSDYAPLAAAARERIWGTQFHPEKSGPDGLRIYANFLRLCYC
ncbi:MAG: imidazole glycerol phosphate synthase subunit HisH [Candidatus Dormibacteraceae bacterium]